MTLSVICLQLHALFAHYFLLNRNPQPGARNWLPLGVSQLLNTKANQSEEKTLKPATFAMLPEFAQELLKRSGKNPYLASLYWAVSAQHLPDPDLRLSCLGAAEEALNQAEQREQAELAKCVAASSEIFAFNSKIELSLDVFNCDSFKHLKTDGASNELSTPTLVKKGVSLVVLYVPRIGDNFEGSTTLKVQVDGMHDIERPALSCSFVYVDNLRHNAQCVFWLESGKARSPSGSTLLLRPLPLPQLYNFLGRTSHLLKLHSLATKFIRKSLAFLLIEENVPEPFLNNRQSAILFKRLNVAALVNYSQTELALFSEGALTLATIESQKRKLQQNAKQIPQWDL